MVGEAEAPMNSKLSVGQLRNRVSSCVHLPMLFQLSPGAVSDMWCGALATDDDTVTCIEIFTDGSSLIPKAWPRVAASGGWGVLVSAICDNQRIAVIGMFFGEVTVDSGHPFFCGANNVQIGACEIQAIWRPWLGVTMSTWRPRVSQSDQTVCMPLEFWTGVTAAFHTCNWYELRGTVWKMQETSCVSTSNTPRHIKGSGKMNLRIPLRRWAAIPFPRKARCPC